MYSGTTMLMRGAAGWSAACLTSSSALAKRSARMVLSLIHIFRGWEKTPCANMDLARLRDEALRPAYEGQAVQYLSLIHI